LGVPSPVVVSLDTLFAGFPPADDATTRACWQRFCTAVLATLPSLAQVVSPEAFAVALEGKLVTPLLAAALDALAREPAFADKRLWRERPWVESLASVEPDFVLTHRREALPAVLSTLFVLEVKPWGSSGGRLERAARQAGGYCRRALYRAFRELADRGASQSELSALSLLCAGSTGDSITFIRVCSGAPASGSYRGAVPCPSVQTLPLPLLAGLDSGQLSVEPPAGFAALMRVLSAPATQLGGPLTVPLDRVQLAQPCVLADGTVLRGALRLGTRLGRGGSCDAYSVENDALAHAVLKLPRCASTAVSCQLDAEVTALSLLRSAGSPHLPALLGAATRALDAPPAPREPWRMLFLAPRGQLAAQRCIGTEQCRAAAASRVMAHLLAVLRLVHSAGLAHCDVRPDNVLAVDEPMGEAPGWRAVLVDFGLARSIGEDARGLGVATFAPTPAAGAQRLPASPALHLQAAAYTWAALAGGEPPGTPPWEHEDERASWLAAAASANGGLWAEVERRLTSLAAGAAVDESFYAWPWSTQE
jgi:hypothetical protein